MVLGFSIYLLDDLTPVHSPTSLLTDDIEAVLENARRNSLTRDNPALADLPAWFIDLRDHQRVAIREILTAYDEGAECVVLDAPTGSGKSLAGEFTRRLLPDNRQTTYICSSKALQDQFIRDYPYAKVLKGRSNYATESYPERFGGVDGLSCSDCTKAPGDSESCLWCISTHQCPYELAKHDALRSELAVLNTSYFLSECNGPGRFSRGGFVIADEADCLEKELMSHVEVRIGERRLKSYGLRVPKYVTKEESWREWAEEAYEKVRSSPPRHMGSGVSELVAIRAAKRHSILVEKLRGLKQGLESGHWVYVGDRNSVAFKPITVNSLGQEKLWQHGDKWLLMSATVISADELLESLGWDEDREWRLVKVPSTFPAENRKVVVWPVASMTYKERDESWPVVVEAIGRILDEHPDEKVVVHSTSYQLTEFILRGILDRSRRDPSNPRDTPVLVPPRQLFSYQSSNEKDTVLANFLSSPPGSVLIAPSVDRGIDLPGDACRVQILCKVPFLSLQDKQVSTRLYGTGRSGKTWYAVAAIRTIVQSCGRAVRSEDDYAVSYILDQQFVRNLWGGHRNLFPAWWKEGLEWRTGRQWRLNGVL